MWNFRWNACSCFVELENREYMKVVMEKFMKTFPHIPDEPSKPRNFSPSKLLSFTVIMIPIDCKTIFLYFFACFLKCNNCGWLIRAYCFKKRLVCASSIDYWNTHKPVHYVLSYVIPITQQYKQRTAWKASLQSIQPLRKIQVIHLKMCAPYLDTRKL